MSQLLKRAIERAEESFDRIRNSVARADCEAIHQTAHKRENSALAVSWAYVWAAATVERFVAEALEAVLTELNSQQLSYSSVRHSLLAMALSPQFDSIRAAKPLRGWQLRAKLLQQSDDNDLVAFNLSIKPLDGRTVTARHLECIWEVFGFQPPHIAHPVQGLALKDLSEGRNRIAHGNVDIIRFGRSKAAPDVLKLLSHVSDTMLHVWDRADDYLSKGSYRR